jgi:hypothetical protein
MGHSLGKIKDKYIFHCEGGDQLCGRMVNGSDFTSEMFAILPPHFLPEADDTLTDTFWNEMLPGYHSKPTGFRAVLPYLLASLLYHEDFLRDTLPPENPIFRSRVFTQNESRDSLKSLVKLGVGRCPYTGMQATGIPPHLAIAGKIETLVAHIKQLEEKLDAQQTYLETLLPSNLSAQVIDDLRQNFTITGVMPVTLKDIQALLTDVRGLVQSESKAMREYVDKRHDDMVALASGQSRIRGTGEWNWAQYQWPDNNVHFVPHGWRVPTQIPVKAAFDWWYHGDKAAGIRPLRLLGKNDIMPCDAMRFTRYKRVMKELADRMELPDGVSSPMELSLPESDTVYNTAFNKLKSDVTNDPDSIQEEQQQEGSDGGGIEEGASAGAAESSHLNRIRQVKRRNDWSYGSAYNAIIHAAKRAKN